MINYLSEVEKRLGALDVDIRRDAVVKLRGYRAGQDTPDVIRLLVTAMQDQSWRVRKAAVEILFEEHPVDVYIESVIKLLYLEDNAGARNSAIEVLIKLGKKATHFLIIAFNTPNNDVRKFIIDVIGEICDKEALPLLIRALKDEDENVKASAVEHLGALKEPTVVDVLIEILKGDDLWTAYPAADALGRIGNKRAVPALIETLKANKTLREPSIRALGRLGDPSALPHMVPFIEDKTKAVKHEALKSTEAIYSSGVSEAEISSAIKGAFGERAVDVLVEGAWSGRAEARAAAIVLLGLMNDERALWPLIDMSRDDDYAWNVMRALIYMGRNKPSALLPLFNTDDPFVLRFVCEAASDVASPEYRDLLVRLLSHEDGHVRAIAATGIANIGDINIVPRLKELLSDPYADVQDAAVKALAKLKDGVSLDELTENMKSSDPVLKRNSVLLIGEAGFIDGVPGVGFALKDFDVYVRRAAVQALSKMKTKEACKYLRIALTDEDPSIRMAAASSLGYSNRPEYVEPLCLMLSDNDDIVSVAAARALGALENRKAVPSLIEMLASKNGFVVTAAIDALGRLGGDDAKTALIGVLYSNDKEVKRTAIRALAMFKDTEDIALKFLKDDDWATRVAVVESLTGTKKEHVRREVERVFDLEDDPVVRRAMESFINA